VHVGLSYFRELITVLGTSEDDIDDITGCTTLMPISPPMMQGLGFDALYAYSYSYIDYFLIIFIPKHVFIYLHSYFLISFCFFFSFSEIS
jgi:hypothetical protein